MKCLIIEDQPPAQRILKKFIADLDSLELVGTFADALKAMSYLQTEEVDLIFLDIHLPKMSGIDFLKSLSHPPQVILTTAFPDYALESYELDVVDYLLKPFSFQRFVKAVAKAQVRTADTAAAPKEYTDSFFVKSGYEHIKVMLADIHYLHADTDYTELVLTDKKVLSSESLKYWESELPHPQFMRVHKSYIVHTEKIEKLVGNQVYLPGNKIVPVGRAYKEDFFQYLAL